MAWIPAVVGGVGALAGTLGHHQPDYNGIIARYRSSRPQGWLTPEDRAFAGAEQNRLTTAVNRSGENSRYQALNRMAQTGLLDSPAAGRDLGRIQQTEAAGHEAAAGAAADTLFNIRSGREQNQWGKERDIFGSQMGVAMNDQRRGDLQQSTFLNSLGQFLPTIMGHFGGGGSSDGSPEQFIGPPAPAGG